MGTMETELDPNGEASRKVAINRGVTPMVGKYRSYVGAVWTTKRRETIMAGTGGLQQQP